eukprot:523657-Amphidinium_carterae.1
MFPTSGDIRNWPAFLEECINQLGLLLAFVRAVPPRKKGSCKEAARGEWHKSSLLSRHCTARWTWKTGTGTSEALILICTTMASCASQQ